MPELTPRLQMAADRVRKGSVVADIGTDHAFLPAFLVKNNICPRALACDLRKGPLDNAKKTIEKYGLSAYIETRLSDGLKEVKENEAGDIVICGMGGNLICDILSPAGWLKNKKYRLILQPQSHAEDVRQFLCENGFEILSEDACKDAGKFYSCMVAEYSGQPQNKPEAFYYFGLLPLSDSPFARDVIAATLKRLKIKAEAAENYGDKAESQRLYAIIDSQNKENGNAL